MRNADNEGLQIRPLNLVDATGELTKLTMLRSVNPMYGVFLVNQLGIADRAERIQAFESVLELPGSVAHFVRVPRQVVAAGPAGRQSTRFTAAHVGAGHRSRTDAATC